MAAPHRVRRNRSLRARVRDAIALVAVLSLLLFGIPLAVVVDRLIGSQARAGLQRDATRGVATVPDNTIEAGSGVVAPKSRGQTRIGVYDARGRLIAGRGPAHSDLAAKAVDGRDHSGHDGDDLAVAVPVLSDADVAGSVRAAEPLSDLRGRVARAWALLAVLAIVVFGIALALARRAARRLSEPFEQITFAARALGDGRYDMQLPRWGIPEADAAGEALKDSARDIDLLVQHERAFVRDASHQLRTPLSGVVLHLEHEPPDVPAALDHARRLETTIEDLVALRGLTGRGSCDPVRVAAEAVQRWTSPSRPISRRSDAPGDIGLSEPALRQSLDVLLDNALRHGGGAVTVTVEPYGDAAVVEVADQGLGFANGAGFGTGLQLAARIVEWAGGTLLVRRRAPAARVALLLPLAGEPAQSTSNR
jgi:signal transduction histidine kinase